MSITYIRFILLCIVTSVLVSCTPSFASDTLRLSYRNDSILRSPEVYALKWGWSVHSGPEYMHPEFDDRGFPVTATHLSTPQLKQINPGLKPMWFRIYLKADPSAVGQPVGFRINAMGNALFYFDGRELKNLRYEKHKDENRDGQLVLFPIFISLKDTATHVLCIKYWQNHSARKWGFVFELLQANSLSSKIISKIFSLSMVMLTVGGVYLSIFVLHFLMFVFNRRDYINLYFALFACSASFLFISTYLSITGQLSWDNFNYLFYTFFVLGLCSITAFSNKLFSTARRLLQAFIGAFLVYLVLYLSGAFNEATNNMLVLCLLVSTLLYILFLYIRAMYQRVPGSYFLGGGIGFTAFFFLGMILLALKKDFNLQPAIGSPATLLFIVCICLSVVAVPVSISAFLAWRSRQAQLQLKDRTEQLARKNESLRAIAQLQSHDIRQPLTSLIGLIYLADENILNLDKNWLTMAKDAADVLDSKIHSIVNESMGNQDIKLYRFNKIVEEIENHAVLLLGSDGTIENWNKGAQAVMGYSAAEIVGKHFSLFFTAEQQQDGVPQQLLEAGKVSGASRSEHLLMRKNSSSFKAHMLLKPIHNEANEVIGFTLVMRSYDGPR